MSITVYTTGPDCYKCKLTMTTLEKAHIPFDEVLLSEAPAEVQKDFKDKGYTQAPVVVTEDDEWSDFRIDKIRELRRKLVPAA